MKSTNDFIINDKGQLEKYIGNDREVVIPDEVCVIGYNAFENNHDIQSVVFSSNVEAVLFKAFSNCENLESVKMSEKTDFIDDWAFCGCSKLKSVENISGLKELGLGAFSDCQSLEEANLPDSIVKIGEYSFEGCNKLEKINISGELQIVGEGAFAQCEKLDSALKERIMCYNSKAFAKMYEKKSTSDLALSTLIFFEFRATLDEKGLLINNIIEKAYSDATNQGAFNTHIEKNSEEREIAESAKGRAKKKLDKAICGYIQPKKEKFVDWQDGICSAIHDEYSELNNKEELFSYGNAQKWVNMTIKYLYMLSELMGSQSVDKGLYKILSSIKKDSAYLCVPIDSYMIDAFWKETNIQQFPGIDNCKSGRDYNYSQPSLYLTGWSNWNEKEYRDFRNESIKYFKSIEEEPLTWEMEMWIKQSKNRR